MLEVLRLREVSARNRWNIANVIRVSDGVFSWQYVVEDGNLVRHSLEVTDDTFKGV